MLLHDVVATFADLPIQLAEIVQANASGIPNPTPAPIPGLEKVASTFIGWLKWLLLIGGVIGLIICGLMMVLGRRNRSAYAVEGASGIPWVIGGVALGMLATSILAGFLKLL
jgi:hypothetical protein